MGLVVVVGISALSSDTFGSPNPTNSYNAKAEKSKAKHTWKTLAEFLDGSRHLFLADSFVLLPFGGRLEILPWQGAS